MNHVYLTVSYIRDLPEVLALRRSLLTLGDDTPHYIVAHSEDALAFADALQDDPHVLLRSTIDYLPAEVETLRARVVAGRRPSKFVRSAMKRFGMRRKVEALQLTGWHYQQLTKIHAAAAMPEECVVILDSDLIAIERPQADHFIRDGKCALFETIGEDMGSSYYSEWLRTTRDFYGLADARCIDANYVFGPVVWSRSMVRDMVDGIERKLGAKILEAFSAHRMQSEYFLYGLFARLSPKFNTLCVATADTLSIEIKEPIAEGDFTSVMERISDTRRRPFLWVHGFVPERQALIERMLGALAASSEA